MKFAVRWSILPGVYEATIKKFLETGAQPPAGVKMLCKYHAVGSVTGFGVVETDDVKGIYSWLADWMEFCSFEVEPVVDDAEAGSLQSQRMRH